MQKDIKTASEYMTVGETAKKMGTTVRTLQYYDKKGLLSPSAVSEGGRRLYTYKDMVRLHEIMSLKTLGFSLEDIKKNLSSLETPKEVVQVLTDQEAKLKEEIQRLSQSLTAMEALKQEVMQMDAVDFKKYADIIVKQRMKNDYYWLIKYFDDEMLNYIRKRFDQKSGLSFMKRFQRVIDHAVSMKEKEIPYDSKEAEETAKEFWNLIMEFIDGNLEMLPQLVSFGGKNKIGNQWGQRQAAANEYLGKALEAWFMKQGINPFEEGQE